MLNIIFLPSVGKPDQQRAIELLAPIIAEAWHAGLARQDSPESVSEHDPQSGDSVA